MHDVATPPLPQPGYVGQLVHQPGGHQQPARPHRPAVGEREPEAVVLPGRGDDLAGDDLSAVPPHLGAAALQQLGRRDPVVAQQSVHTLGGCVARRPGVDHQDRAAGPGQHQRSVQPGGAAAEHHHVVLVLQLFGVHASMVRRLPIRN